MQLKQSHRVSFRAAPMQEGVVLCDLCEAHLIEIEDSYSPEAVITVLNPDKPETKNNHHAEPAEFAEKKFDSESFLLCGLSGLCARLVFISLAKR